MKSKWLSMCGIYFISAVLMTTKNCREIPKNDRKIAMNKVHNIGQQGGRMVREEWWGWALRLALPGAPLGLHCPTQ